MTDEVLGYRGAVAAGDPVAPSPAFLQMGGGDGENVAAPFAGGKTHGGMQGVVGRMGAPIHPDGALSAPSEVVDVNRDQILGVAVTLFPDADIGEAEGIIG